MKLFDDSKDLRWLFCMTHPDDEIAIGAWMRRLVRNGNEVWSGWSVSNPERETESRAVMKNYIGIPQENLFFFYFPDGSTCDQLIRLTESWANAIERSAPDRVVVTAFECGHLDHDATNFAVYHAMQDKLKRKIPILEVPLYHTYIDKIPILNRFTSPENEEVIKLTEEEQKFKKVLSRQYPSQRIASLLVYYHFWKWIQFKHPKLTSTERMRLQTHFDYMIPNLPEAVKQKVMKSEKWKRWIQSVEKYEKEKMIV